MVNLIVTQHTVTLVRTRGLNENLGFENWKKKIKGEGGGNNNYGGFLEKFNLVPYVNFLQW